MHQAVIWGRKKKRKRKKKEREGGEHSWGAMTEPTWFYTLAHRARPTDLVMGNLAPNPAPFGWWRRVDISA